MINQVTIGPDLVPEVRLDVIVPAGTADGDYPLTINATRTVERSPSPSTSRSKEAPAVRSH